METFNQHQGTIVPLMNDNIDTDQIIPKDYLKRIEKTGFGQFLFDEWRYLEDRSPNPTFSLNQPQYQGATILITGDNFGSGSSREHAAWALQDFGFHAIIAGSYSDIFFMNAMKNGLLPLVMPVKIRQQLAALSGDSKIIIDLPAQKIITSFGEFPFDFDPDWKEKLVNGLDDISITLTYAEKIDAYEKTIPSYYV
ncbi:3-isopropylmalate dehydratase small subunit [Enterococcus sp. JM9B]|uniref:3-isopropylmalate dehydratase small subunit n=1 Tax=Enterococcus sp. JM9B TaxID=1857216 RepID=UPI00137520C4|nr:3-isopropylmalate dehydratase small subunit [Enterococcus sp. JM9B]KAF1300518.1 3-isopropylmalate dehydratase small subunit [Enterococcus sp. JM9B]